ncbi:MAG: hypothetical protein INQ03_09900 [Candidatus Heimdallarchaeota archaeon]|nr:hypothetical protein [Candidatus Heimdallarchaeota archaeon]
MIKTLILQTTFGQIFYSKEGFFGAAAGESDISLTAGLISAIYSMTEETQAQKIEEIELEDLRSVFRELPGEKLFIVTVDKRMDVTDSADLLQDFIDGFNHKYGEDFSADGMILNDFEPVVDDIVERRLWYNTAPPKLALPDWLVFLTLLFSFIWYPYFLLNSQTTIVDPIFSGNLTKNIHIGSIPMSIVILLEIIIPIGVNLFLLNKFPNFKLIFKYIKEFIIRPTRGGYAEMLPNWFMTVPILVAAGTASIIVSGRGIVHSLTLQAFTENLIEARVIAGSGASLFWIYIYVYMIFFFFSWYIVPPLILGVATGNYNWSFVKPAILITSIASITLIPGHLIGGEVYQTLVGFDLINLDTYGAQSNSLSFLFLVTLPANIFIAVNIFFMGVGLGPLIRKNRSRFTIAFGISVFAVLQLVQLFWWWIFESGILFESFV